MEQVIQEILNDIQKILAASEGPNNRREYMDSIGVSGRD